MVKKSKRCNLRKKQSLQRNGQRKSRKNIRFFKSGGNGAKEMLERIDQMRNARGEFGVVVDEDLSKLSGAELIAKLRKIRKASDGSISFDESAQYGKEHLLMKQISKYTNELITELLQYNTNSLRLLLLTENDAFNVNPSTIQQYLKSSMWESVGVENFANWVNQKMKPLEGSMDSKPQITINDLFRINRQINAKYPEIIMGNKEIHDLIVKDLLQKMYYLNIPKSVQHGGTFGAFVEYYANYYEGDITIIGTAMFVWFLFYIAGPDKSTVQFKRNSAYQRRLARRYAVENERGPTQPQWLIDSHPEVAAQGYNPRISEWWYKPTNSDSDYGRANFLTKFFSGHSPDDEADFIDDRVDEYESREPALLNRVDADVSLMRQNIKPKSELFDEAEKAWKWNPWSERTRLRDMKLPPSPWSLSQSHQYKPEFVDYKVREYEEKIEPALRRMDRRLEKREALSDAVFNQFGQQM